MAAHGGPSRVVGRDLLRFVACGSVDDGKSTLIGRMLCESGAVPIDQIENVERLSRRFGSAGDGIDYALLLDGLETEREQGITIDVAYRFFATERRAFIVADTPGHDQYTRNMVTGASTSDLAVLLVDVRQGMTTQTMRHTRLAALLGIRRLLLVVNKMDLVDFDQDGFERVRREYEEFARGLGLAAVSTVPAAACFGDNVVTPSPRMPWFAGPTVLSYLEDVEIEGAPARSSVRYCVQAAVRADGGFRGYAGTVAVGDIETGDRLVIARTGQEVGVDRIVTFDGDRVRATRGQAITLVLDRNVDVGRGDVIAGSEPRPDFADQMAATIVWFDEAPLLPGRTYVLRLGTQEAPVTITAVKHKIDVATGEKVAARVLDMNDIGVCNLATTGAIAFDPYDVCPPMGAFILVDRFSAATVGAGMVGFALRRASNLKHQDFSVDKARRAGMKGHKPCVIWFTGLSGAGKSTIMNLVEQQLAALGVHTYALDGDNVRHGLNRDLGFSDADRVENIRRIGEVAKMMVDAGLVTLCAFISPFRAERRTVRDLLGPGEFFEIFVDTPIEVCIERDPKGLYAKAKTGEALHVTGLDSPYEVPDAPDLRLETTAHSAEHLADTVVRMLVDRIHAGPQPDTP